MWHAFSKADAIVPDDAIACHATIQQCLGFAQQKVAYLRDSIALHVLQVHVLRRLVHVHEADTAAVVGCDHILCAGLAQSPDVIDDVRSQIQHSLHDLGFVGIHRNSHAQPDCFLYYGQYACQFFLQGDGGRAGAGGLSADIQNIRTVLDQLLGMLQGTLALVLAAIRKRVWGVVDDAHDQRALEVQQEMGGLPLRHTLISNGQRKTGHYGPV